MHRAPVRCAMLSVGLSSYLSGGHKRLAKYRTRTLYCVILSLKLYRGLDWRAGSLINGVCSQLRVPAVNSRSRAKGDSVPGGVIYVSLAVAAITRVLQAEHLIFVAAKCVVAFTTDPRHEAPIWRCKRRFCNG